MVSGLPERDGDENASARSQHTPQLSQRLQPSGVVRLEENLRYKSPVEIDLMRRIKHAMDPAGILNPGKVIVG